MRKLTIILSCVLFFCAVATAQDHHQIAKAQAALALAKATRERDEREQLVALAGCFNDEKKAKALAEKLGKKLVLWVGMTCEDVPTIRKDLADCVHCHVTTHNGDTTPRVVVTAPDGKEYRVERPDLSTAAVRHIWGEQ